MTIRPILALALISMTAAAGCNGSKSSGGSGGGSSGKGTAPVGGSAVAASAVGSTSEVTLKPLKYAELQSLIASKKGKVVVLDVWSTYCEPCMAEFPGLVALDKKYGPDKVACISLCLNFGGVGKATDPEYFDEPLKFLKEKGATFDNVMSADSDNDIYGKMKFGSVPAIFVYDRDGKEIKRFVNEAKYSEVEAFVAPLLK